MENQGKKIFVVDDDASIGEVVSLMLEMEGYDVFSFDNGRAGVEKILIEMPDLILLDYFLPGENVEEIIDNLRINAGPDLPILLMSASSQAEQASKSLDINEFIPKPFQRDLLLQAIDRNLN